MSVWAVFLIPFIVGGIFTLIILLAYSLLATAVNSILRVLWN